MKRRIEGSLHYSVLWWRCFWNISNFNHEVLHYKSGILKEFNFLNSVTIYISFCWAFWYLLRVPPIGVQHCLLSTDTRLLVRPGHLIPQPAAWLQVFVPTYQEHTFWLISWLNTDISWLNESGMVCCYLVGTKTSSHVALCGMSYPCLM